MAEDVKTLVPAVLRKSSEEARVGHEAAIGIAGGATRPDGR